MRGGAESHSDSAKPAMPSAAAAPVSPAATDTATAAGNPTPTATPMPTAARYVVCLRRSILP